LAGLRHTRKVIGCEKESEYVSILKERIVQLDAGTLGYRQLGKTVYQPTRREKVAQIPIEWFK
jgi:adenine-specific DNA-methyltransferase